MATSDAVQALERDLRGVFGGRLQSLSVYGARAHVAAHHDSRSAQGPHAHEAPPIQTMAVVGTLTPEDLRACAARLAAWHELGLATPFLLAAHEFGRSLDAFPLEFGAILADHAVVSGSDPFGTLTVDPADIRRACEVQARSHLLHLREGFLETHGRADALSLLIVRSAAALMALVMSLARLDGHAAADPAAAARHAERTLGVSSGAIEGIVALVGVHDMSSADAERLFPSYLDAIERLVKHVDSWSAR